MMRDVELWTIGCGCVVERFASKGLRVVAPCDVVADDWQRARLDVVDAWVRSSRNERAALAALLGRLDAHVGPRRRRARVDLASTSGARLRFALFDPNATAAELHRLGVWIDARGRRAHVSTLDDAHLSNIWMLLRRRAHVAQDELLRSYIYGPQPSGDGACDAFDAELDAICGADPLDWFYGNPFVYPLECEMYARGLLWTSPVDPSSLDSWSLDDLPAVIQPGELRGGWDEWDGWDTDSSPWQTPPQAVWR